MKHKKNSKISILLCTYNGEKYLESQLKSFENQTIANNINLVISDDGSSDKTLNILKVFKKESRIPTKIISRKSAHGFGSNFAFITSQKFLSSDYYAWSDQDDIWINDKLERALKVLNAINPKTPAVFSSRTIITNNRNINIG